MEKANIGKTAVVIGAGNIGRGFIGALFAASGYEVVFVDVDENLVNEINLRGEYPVRVLLPDGNHIDTVVDGVRAVNGKDTGASAAEISKADICAVSVGVRALPFVAPGLAMGLALRTRNESGPLNIIVCENMMDAGRALRGYVSDMAPPDIRAAIDGITGYPDAVIARMVPVQTDSMKDGDPLRICVEKYAFLPVDKAAFKGEASKVSGMILLDNFEYYVKRKLFIHNLGHAAVAYLGLLKGYEYIAEALDDADILYMAASAMRESAAALNCENPGDAANLQRNIDSLLYRFSNKALGDTCARVAADPARKLGKSDRIIGSLTNCEQYGLPAVYISAVAAAAALALEKTVAEKSMMPDLSEITGLPQEGKNFGLIADFGMACVSAAVNGDDPVAALRRMAVDCAGEITIL